MLFRYPSCDTTKLWRGKGGRKKTFTAIPWYVRMQESLTFVVRFWIPISLYDTISMLTLDTDTGKKNSESCKLIDHWVAPLLYVHILCWRTIIRRVRTRSRWLRVLQNTITESEHRISPLCWNRKIVDPTLLGVARNLHEVGSSVKRIMLFLKHRTGKRALVF